MNMLEPTHCPRCKDPLTSDFISDNLIVKRCSKRIDHQFSCMVKEGDKFLTSATITISMNPIIKVAWNFVSRTVMVGRGSVEEMIKDNRDPEPLPWFDPDFSDFKSLVTKLKTYVLFS